MRSVKCKGVVKGGWGGKRGEGVGKEERVWERKEEMVWKREKRVGGGRRGCGEGRRGCREGGEGVEWRIRGRLRRTHLGN